MSKHTPGPWEACIQDADSGEKWFDIWSAHGSVAHVSECARPDDNLRTFRADAKLIAVAPEMFDALDKALEVISFCYMNSPEQPKEIALIRAVLAKAGGTK